MPREDADLELHDESETVREEDAPEDALEADGQDGDEGEGSDDADGQEDVGDEGPDEVADDPPKRLSRGERRIQAVRKEAREATAKTQRLEEELIRLRAERQNQQPQLSPEDEAAQERERLAIMTPDERTEYRLAKSERNNARQIQQMRIEQQDALDQAQYQTRAASDPRFKRYEPEVNKRLRELRAQGQNVTREALLKFILGEKLLERDAAAGAKQKAAAGKRVQRQAAPRMNGRTDVATTRGRDSSLEKRLTGVQL